MTRQGFFLVGTLVTVPRTNDKGTYVTAHLLPEGSNSAVRINGKFDVCADLIPTPIGSTVMVSLWPPRESKFGGVDISVREVVEIDTPAALRPAESPAHS